ncbi:MAG: hypothetical protein COA58_03820 [Bacteroidetes bacterium]|nr:MAG: hypothetical protein COA58_03820 [Bacteroidota bacterium]
MLQELSQRPNTKQTINDIIEFIGDSTELFAELMDIFLNGTLRVSQMTSWALGHIGEQKPELITPYHSELVAQLQNPERHSAVRRNIVRIYQTCEIPKEIEGELYEISIGFVLDPKEAIAIRAFSMRICERIAIRYPDLAPELIDAIKSILPNASSGLKNRGRHTVNDLNKLIGVQ